MRAVLHHGVAERFSFRRNLLHQVPLNEILCRDEPHIHRAAVDITSCEELMKCMLQLRCCMDGHGPFGQLVATTAVQSLPQHGFSVHVMLSSPEFARLGCCRLAALSKYSRWIRRSCLGRLFALRIERTHTQRQRCAVQSVVDSVTRVFSGLSACRVLGLSFRSF